MRELIKKYNFQCCKILKGKKYPSKKNWVNEPESQEDILSWIEKGQNYGVICGYNNLCVIDCDTKYISEYVKARFPKTLTVKTGSGGFHFYYYCPGLTKKIILQRGEEHHGEVQSVGTQVVGAGSLHPNGKIYEIVDSSPIQEINYMDLISNLKEYIPELDNISSSTELNDLDITDIINTSGFKRKGSVYAF